MCLLGQREFPAERSEATVARPVREDRPFDILKLIDH
jgi:hypothetical protein